MEPLVLDPETAVKGLAVLTAIPVVMFALWAEYFGRYVEGLFKGNPRLDRAIEIGRIRVASALVFLFQLTLFLGTTDVRTEYPLPCAAIFVLAIGFQFGTHAALVRKIRGLGAAQVTAEMLRPPVANVAKAAAEPASPAGVRPAQPTDPRAAAEYVARSIRAVLWLVLGAGLYMGVLVAFVEIFAWATTALHLSPTASSAAVITGAIVGIVAGLGLNFALGPIHLRKMLPVTELSDVELKSRLTDCFGRAGLPAPDFWIVEGDASRSASAMIAGFRGGRGIFRPGMFISRNLLTLLNADELLAVISHEVSHLRLRHLRRRFMLSAGMILASTCAGTCVILAIHHFLGDESAQGFVGPLIGLAAFVMTMQTLSRQSKLQEIEADIHSIEFLGSKVTDLSNALRKLDQHNGEVIGAAAQSLMTGTAHPSTEKRIRIMYAYLEAKARKTASPVTADDSSKDQDKAA